MAEYVWIDGSNGVRSKTKVSLSLHLFFLIKTSPPYYVHAWLPMMDGVARHAENDRGAPQNDRSLALDPTTHEITILATSAKHPQTALPRAILFTLRVHVLTTFFA
jgi:hypothetical protein